MLQCSVRETSPQDSFLEILGHKEPHASICRGVIHDVNRACIGEHVGWCSVCERIVSIRQRCDIHRPAAVFRRIPEPPCGRYFPDRRKFYDER